MKNSEEKAIRDVIKFKRVTSFKRRKILLRDLVKSLLLYKHNEKFKSNVEIKVQIIKDSGLIDMDFLILDIIQDLKIFCLNKSGQFSRFIKQKAIPVYAFEDLRHFSIIELEKILGCKNVL